MHTYILQHHRHFIIDFISLLCLKGPDQLQVSVVLNKQSLLYKTDERCTGAGGVCVCVCLLGGLKVEKEVQSVKELSQVNNSSHASCSAAAARGVGTQFLRYMTTSKTIHSED